MDTFSTLILFVLIVGLTSGSDIVNEYPSQKKKYETSEYSKELVRAPVPENTKPGDFSLPDDKCGDFSVRFKDDDYCYPLLERGPCSNPYFWVTVDPYTFKGVCTPRLCGRDKVFVGRTGKCHDIYDTYECRGGRRLYYSAYGDPICDCPVGQYPFPYDGDDCVPIFTQGPCPDDHVVTPTSSGKLECKPNSCPSSSTKSFGNFILQFVRVKNDAPYTDQCYALGTKGPCCSSSDFLGYDIFKLKPACVDLEDPSSPYFSSSKKNDVLNELYDPADKEYDYDNSTTSSKESYNRTRRQGVITLPTSTPNSLLNPCQQGGRDGANLKCANPLVPGASRNPGTSTRSVFSCQGNDFLQANGQCSSNAASAACGPSFRYVAATKQCRRRT